MAKRARRKTSNVVTMPTPAATTTAAKQAREITARDIAQRAFELYCERGCQHGHDVDDWLQAECERRGVVTSAVA